MKCRESRKAQSEELRSGSRPVPRGELANHLSACPRCRKRWDGNIRLIDRLRSAYLAIPRVDVIRRVMARVHQLAPGLARDLRIDRRQLVYSLGAGTALAALLGVVAILRAPQALRETPVTRLTVWIPRLMVEIGLLLLETVEFLVQVLASGLRYLTLAGDKLEFLAPVSILLTAIIAAALLGATAIAVRRDLIRDNPGTPWNGGKL